MFLPNAPMHFLIENQRAASLQQGLLEVLSVHLPEVHAVELADCVGGAREFRAVRSAFTTTFALRSEKAFHAATDSYVNSVITRYADDRYQLNEALINLAALTGHPFNAERLHRALNRFELPCGMPGGRRVISGNLSTAEAPHLVSLSGLRASQSSAFSTTAHGI